MSGVIELAQGRWRSILSGHGMGESFLTGKHGPCPLCGGKDRFRFVNKTQAGSLDGIWVCNQCRPGMSDGMELLMQFTGLEFKQLAQEIEDQYSTAKQDQPIKTRDPRILLDRTAQYCRPLNEINPVRTYLRSRGINVVSKSIRYNQSIRYYDNGIKIGEYPAMVSRITDSKGNRESFHITYLKHTGEKADLDPVRKILPPINTINGCGVYLAGLSDHMLLGEGIETTLAGMQLFGLPGIACLSANGMEKINMPESVRVVTILADNDANYRGQLAAFTLASRLHKENRDVTVKIPEDHGDFLDVLNQAGQN